MSRLTASIDRWKLGRAWIRGNDPRSWLRRLRDLREGESGLVHAFGDSHLGAMSGLSQVIAHRLPGTSMFRVARDEAWFLRRTAWRRGRKSALLFAFGAIDARVHVGRIASRTGRPVAAVIDELVMGYFAALERGRGGRQVVICAVSPTVTDEMARRTDSRFYGTVAERVVWTRLLNETLRQASAAHGYAFCDPYDGYADERGCLRFELSDGSLHLSREMAGPMRAAVQATLQSLQGPPVHGTIPAVRAAPDPAVISSPPSL